MVAYGRRIVFREMSMFLMEALFALVMVLLIGFVAVIVLGYAFRQTPA